LNQELIHNPYVYRPTLRKKGNYFPLDLEKNDVVPGWIKLPNAMIVPKIGLEGDLHNPLKTIEIIGWRQILSFPAGGNACQFFLQTVKDWESINLRREWFFLS
jgi:hypothetical protein